MYKSVVLLCVMLSVIIEARPKWQFLPPRDGYIPVYIRPGDTPLEDINPDLAEAFHALPVGRSSGKHLEANEDIPEEPVDIKDAGELVDIKKLEEPVDIKNSEEPESIVDKRPYEKKLLEKKNKKATEVFKPERR